MLQYANKKKQAFQKQKKEENLQALITSGTKITMAKLKKTIGSDDDAEEEEKMDVS